MPERMERELAAVAKLLAEHRWPWKSTGGAIAADQRHAIANE
jgi:hypothetical protein